MINVLLKKEFKMGRPKLALNLRCVSTSIRLRPDRLAKYKEMGGVRWLNSVIDAQAEQAATIKQLQAENAKLREALEVCKYDCETGEVIGIAKDALGETK